MIADVDLDTRLIDGQLTRTHAVTDTGDHPIILQPLRYVIQQNQYGLDVTLLDADGEEAASVFIAIDADGKTPVLRIWDCELGMGNDPVHTRRMHMTEPAD